MAYYLIPFLNFVSQIDNNLNCIPKTYYFRYISVFLTPFKIPLRVYWKHNSSSLQGSQLFNKTAAVVTFKELLQILGVSLTLNPIRSLKLQTIFE